MLNFKILKISSFISFTALAINSILFVSLSIAETDTGTARVEIRQPVVLSELAQLNFGIVSSNDADVITISSNGDISSLNGANIAGASNAGRFAASGQANSNVTISFASGVVSGVGDDMVVNNFTHNLGSSPSFDGDGALAFDVGGDLQVNSSQIPGVYTGTYQVSLNYQ